MDLTMLLLILLLVVVTLLVGAGVLALLMCQPSWCAPVAGSLAVMTLMVSAAGVLVVVARS
ncbi:hypothetical protein ACQ86D_23240 [Streptomyces galilaeus]